MFVDGLEAMSAAMALAESTSHGGNLGGYYDRYEGDCIMRIVGVRRPGLAMTCVFVGIAFLFSSGNPAFADTGANVTVNTPQGKPAEGADVTMTPLYPKGSTGKTVKTDKDGKAAFPGLTPGNYTVTVTGSTVTTYYIHVEKDKTTEQKSSEEGSLSFVKTPDAKNVGTMVDAINDAAKDCKKILYESLKASFGALLKNVQAEFDELDKIVNDEHDQNNLPMDIGGLDDVKGVYMEPEKRAAFDAYYALVQERDRVKGILDMIKAKEKDIKPFATNCDPPKSGTTTEPPKTEPPKTDAPKTDTPPPSDKPR